MTNVHYSPKDQTDDKSLTKIENLSRTCRRFTVWDLTDLTRDLTDLTSDLTDLSVISGLVKSEARDRGLGLRLTSPWLAARKGKNC